MTRQTFDLVIVGSGPNGLYAYYKFRTLFPAWEIVLIEKEKYICAGIRGYPNVKWHSNMSTLKLATSINSQINDEARPTSQEIANYYEEFARTHQIPIRLDHELVALGQGVQKNKVSNSLPFSVLDIVSNGKRSKILSRYVILATGISSGPRRLSIESEKIHYGYSLSIKGKHLILVGAGNSSVDFITHLLPHNTITWIIRGETFSNIFPEILSDFNSVLDSYGSKLRIINNAVISKLGADGALILSNGIKIKKFDSCHILIGYIPKNSLNTRLDLKFSEESLVLSKEFETSNTNIFAFGSLMARPDKATGRLSQTFVSNGNDEKLQHIVDAISRREVERIFGNANFLVEKKQLDVAQRFPKSWTFGLRFVKNLTLRHYIKAALVAILKIESKVR
jgi:thioredoxin reductase